MIYVVNKYKHIPTIHDIYIGRPSPIGNPFTHLNTNNKAQFKVATREEAIEKYKEWIKEKINNRDPEILNELTEIIKAAEKSDINLVCFCHPLPCHGHIIKKILDNFFKIIEK